MIMWSSRGRHRPWQMTSMHQLTSSSVCSGDGLASAGTVIPRFWATVCTTDPTTWNNILISINTVAVITPPHLFTIFRRQLGQDRLSCCAQGLELNSQWWPLCIHCGSGMKLVILKINENYFTLKLWCFLFTSMHYCLWKIFYLPLIIYKQQFSSYILSELLVSSQTNQEHLHCWVVENILKMRLEMKVFTFSSVSRLAVFSWRLQLRHHNTVESCRVATRLLVSARG